jgi:hypothetical protein
MRENSMKALKIFNDMKECAEAIGLPVLQEHAGGDLPNFMSIGVRCGEYSMYLLVYHYVSEEMVTAAFWFDEVVPPEARKTVSELMNLINIYTRMCRYIIHPADGVVALESGMVLANGTLNKQQFRRLLKELLGEVELFHPLIREYLSSNKEPEAIMSDFFEAHPDF